MCLFWCLSVCRQLFEMLYKKMKEKHFSVDEYTQRQELKKKKLVFFLIFYSLIIYRKDIKKHSNRPDKQVFLLSSVLFDVEMKWAADINCLLLRSFQVFWCWKRRRRTRTHGTIIYTRSSQNKGPPQCSPSNNNIIKSWFYIFPPVHACLWVIII